MEINRQCYMPRRHENTVTWFKGDIHDGQPCFGHAKALLLVTEKSENGTSGCWPITNALRPL